MVEDKKLRQKFDKALELFMNRIEPDNSILAVFVLGSYTNGIVWEKSDIDMVIVTNEERVLQDLIVVRENDVQINAYIMSRNDYRRNQQRFLQGSMMHHMLSTSKLIHSIDRGISEFNRDMFTVAERDRELQILVRSEILVSSIHKIKKTLYIEESLENSFNWVILATQEIARILIFLEGKIPGRDIITQAQEVSTNQILENIISNVFKKGFSKESVEYTLNLVEDFLNKNTNKFFKPLFDYLKESIGERSHSEIDRHFQKTTGFQNLSLFESISWLSDLGVLMLGAKPKRITARSRVTVDETTVFYIGGEE
ncbi:MAG: nucleotidyltransferase domain-containing protein [Candidatus Heimdallarchaeota archaeon]|nr:MAG: nucleotidyltransferase domain-containing protein [Candidatus Heimdallarchaeota archaeon]